MISSSQVKDKLIDNPDLLINVLEGFGFCNVTYRSTDKEIKCSFEEGSKHGGVNVYPNSLYSVYYAKGISGSIYDLLMYKSGLNFSNTHKKIVSILGGGTFSAAPKKQLFGGIYKKFMPQQDGYNIYNENVLSDYTKIANLRFYDDGIDTTVQRLFGIMYDTLNDLIIIPWRDEFGSIIGVKTRVNFEIEQGKSKYFAIQNFSKTSFLYGIDVTRSHCIKNNRVYVAEAEKCVMQMFTKGYKNCVAIGGHDIHQTQATHLKYLCNEIVLMFDEDVTEEQLITQCERLVNSNMFTKNKVGYIIDRDKTILSEKESPGDKSKEEVDTLLNNITWFN